MQPLFDPARPDVTLELIAHFSEQARRERDTAIAWAFRRAAALLGGATGRRWRRWSVAHGGAAPLR